MRYLLSVFIALAVTALLFWGMQSLIESGDNVMTEPPRGNVLDFVRVKQEETVQQKKRLPKKPPKPEEPPPPLEQPQLTQNNNDTDSSGMSFAADIVADAGLSGGLSLESGDGEYLPIVKVAPVYPRRAQSRGIEGYVIVEFVVTKTGSVRDPVVVEAEPEGVFERAALEAASKFKYKPRVVDGEATEVADVRNKITFKLGG